MAEVLEAGATCVITAGGVQSNHVRQTAAAAAKLGLAAHLVLTRNVPQDAAREHDGYDRTGNILLDRLLGAEIRILPAGGDRAATMWLIKRIAVDHWDVERATEEAIALGQGNPDRRQFAIEYAQANRR